MAPSSPPTATSPFFAAISDSTPAAGAGTRSSPCRFELDQRLVDGDGVAGS